MLMHNNDIEDLDVIDSLTTLSLASHTDIRWARHANFMGRDEPKKCLCGRLLSRWPKNGFEVLKNNSKDIDKTEEYIDYSRGERIPYPS